MIELRLYQEEILTKTKESFRAGKRRILCVAPTGSG